MERSKVTWRDYIAEFEEPYRSQILHNIQLFDNGQRLDEDVMETFFEKPSMSDIVDEGFFWRESPEGHRYWSNFTNKLS